MTTTLRDAYIELLKRALLGLTVAPVDLHVPKPRESGWRSRMIGVLERAAGGVLSTPVHFDLSVNSQGTDSVWDLPHWPLTMIGTVRMTNVEECVRDVLENSVPGDFIEAGVWRGGTTIFMRGLLRAFDDAERSVVVADSFEGLPPPNVAVYPQDEGLDLHLWPGLAVSLEEVRANFDRFDLLDDRVEFVKGWFSETLPGLRDRQWAILRLDGDMYESTMDALENLYPGLAPGGWLIVDDFEIPACARAVEDYRAAHGITEPMVSVDWTAVCWKKVASV